MGTHDSRPSLIYNQSVLRDTYKPNKHMNKIQTVLNTNKVVNMAKVNSILANVETAIRKRFDSSCELAAYVSKAAEWYKTADAKEVLKNSGIDLKIDAFFMEAFGFQKSYAYKLIRLHTAKEHLPTFNEACDKDSTLDRSVAGFLKFIKGDGEGEGEAKAETIITFTWKTDDGNIAFKVDSENVLHSSLDAKELKSALKKVIAML